jgi:hypothetical protein
METWATTGNGDDKMKKAQTLLVTLMILMMLGCAAGPNELANTPTEDGKVAGFWHRLWHGFIALFTFIISLFTDSVRIYEVHNSGNWYNFGFLLGVMIFFGGGCGGARKGSRRR